MTDASLVEAAQFERDHRSGSYARRIQNGEQIDVEIASIDFQAWVAIAEWLEADRFTSFVGGADPERPDAPIIRWSHLEAAAEKAMGSVTAKLNRLEGEPGCRPETLAELRARRSRLFVIHRKVQLRRQSIDTINRELQVQRQDVAA